MKKGFTLIELLAVIVILAIIALIVTPVVSNIVTNARIAANARSVEGHIRNIEIAIISEAFSGTTTGDLDSYDNITSGTTIESSLTLPNNDNVTCSSYSIKHGKVESAEGCTDSEEKWGDKYKYSESLGAYVFGFKGTVILAGLDSNGNPTQNIMSSTLSIPMANSLGERIVTYLGIVYIDPSNIKEVCNASSTLTTGNTGCKKFYIYKEDENSYYMIMDRNTTDTYPWINHDDYITYLVSVNGYTNEQAETSWSNGYKNRGGNKTVIDRLKLDTKDWVGSSKLISVSEIRQITSNSTNDYYYFGSDNKNTSYSSQNEEQKAKQESFHWLFDYTGCSNKGCEISYDGTSGYWTNDAYSGAVAYAYTVDRDGRLFKNNAASTSPYGIRPVLVIPKSLIG